MAAKKANGMGTGWQKAGILAAFLIPIAGVALGLYSQQRVLVSDVERLDKQDKAHEAAPMHHGTESRLRKVDTRLRKIEVTQAVIVTKLDIILEKVKKD